LTGDGLLQPLHHDLALREDTNAGRFQGLAGGGSIAEEEMSDAIAADNPRAPSFDTHPGTAQGLTHLGESSGAVLKGDGEILHRRFLGECPSVNGKNSRIIEATT
jgi:hypothetical protein